MLHQDTLLKIPVRLLLLPSACPDPHFRPAEPSNAVVEVLKSGQIVENNSYWLALRLGSMSKQPTTGA